MPCSRPWWRGGYSCSADETVTDGAVAIWHHGGMARLASVAEHRQVLVHDGATAADVTWPVRLRRWWEARRGEGVFPRRRPEPAPVPAALWGRVERAFRLMDVADSRPDPSLTRRIAQGLLDEVDARLATVDDAEERHSLGRAVAVIRRELRRENVAVG